MSCSSAAGAALLPIALEMLDLEARARSVVDEPSAVPHVVIAGFASAITTVLVPRLAALREHANVEITEAEDTDALRDLGLGAVDVVLTQEYEGAPAERVRRFTYTPLVSDRLTLVLPPDMSDTTTIDDLGDAPWLLNGRSTRCAQATMRILDAAGVAPRIVGTVADNATLLALVAAGQGVTVVPARVLDDAAHAVTIAEQDLRTTRTILAVTRTATTAPLARLLEHLVTRRSADDEPGSPEVRDRLRRLRGCDTMTARRRGGPPEIGGAMRGRVGRWMVGALLAAAVSVGVGPPSPVEAAASTPLGARVAWAQTNGDILAITKIEGASRDLIVFGGNFTAVITPDGVSRPARHFAVVDEFSGALVYAGNASSYVRSITSRDGVTYVGGDFTTFGGVARNRLAALSPSFTVTSWNPAPSFRVRAVVAGPSGVYYGGDGAAVRLVDGSTGAIRWSQPHAGGSVRSLALSPSSGALYVGGLFETYGTLTRHGLIRANPLTGAPDPVFNANFRADSGVGANGNYDGEAGNVLQFTPDGARLLVGVAGHGSDVFKVLNPITGALVWVKVLPGDCQGVAVVGSTYVVGYHRNRVNGAIPYPYYAAQLESSNSALSTWDPGLTGVQSNADGGNNGVQAIYADPVNRRLFVAGAFTMENGRPLKSLAVYTWGGATNQPPTAAFTSSASGLTASLNGGGSSDPDGSISSWSWDFGDGTQGTGATVQHTYPAAGTYTVTLRVTDNERRHCDPIGVGGRVHHGVEHRGRLVHPHRHGRLRHR